MTDKAPNIRIGDIEQELETLYSNNGGQEQVRACLFNLIVFSPTEERGGELHDIVGRITEKFPCRILFIQNDTQKDQDYLRVIVSSAKIGSDNSAISCDFIKFFVSTSQLKRIPFVILPNIVSDLPVYLLWGADPTLEHEILPHLQNLATRLVFYSKWIENLQPFANRLLTYISASKTEITDATWNTLSSWRDNIAQIFDTPEKQEDLRQTKTVKLTYVAGKKEDATPAIFLQGWLASQLGWKFLAKESSHQKMYVLYKSKVSEISLELIPETRQDIQQGEIIAFELTTLGGNVYSADKRQDISKVTLHISTPESCELPYKLSQTNLLRGFNFMKEIFYQTSGDQYKNMLWTIAQINWEK